MKMEKKEKKPAYEEKRQVYMTYHLFLMTLCCNGQIYIIHKIQHTDIEAAMLPVLLFFEVFFSTLQCTQSGCRTGTTEQQQ